MANFNDANNWPFIVGTDKANQNRGTYDVGRTSVKLWRYIWWFIINSCIVNAWIIYQKVSRRQLGKKYTHLDFRLELVEELSAPATQTRALSRPPAIEPAGRDHQNVRMPHKRPRVCKTHKRYNPMAGKKETTRGCRLCGIYLCLDCHIRYHTT